MAAERRPAQSGIRRPARLDVEMALDWAIRRCGLSPRPVWLQWRIMDRMLADAGERDMVGRSPQPRDALYVAAMLLELDPFDRALVVECARSCSRPDWGRDLPDEDRYAPILDARGEPVEFLAVDRFQGRTLRRGRIRGTTRDMTEAEAAAALDLPDGHRGRVSLSRAVERPRHRRRGQGLPAGRWGEELAPYCPVVNLREARADRQAGYLRWHDALTRLAGLLRAEPRLEVLITGPAAPREPWLLPAGQPSRVEPAIRAEVLRLARADVKPKAIARLTGLSRRQVDDCLHYWRKTGEL